MSRDEIAVIDQELTQIQQVVGECAESRRTLDSNRQALYACAFLLQTFYTGVERILERSLKSSGAMLPESDSWHRQLLQIAAREEPGIRPAILSETTRLALDEFRGFRHVARTHYGFEIEPKKLLPLLEKLDSTWDCFHEEAVAFLEFLKRR